MEYYKKQIEIIIFMLYYVREYINAKTIDDIGNIDK